MKKVFAIFLAAMMLTLNVGVTVAEHYCAGEIVKSSVSLTTTDINCGMQERPVLCEDGGSKPEISKTNCCENKFVQVKMDEEYNSPQLFHPDIDLQFVTAFVVSYFLLTPETAVSTFNAEYSPPHLDHDIQVMIQSFLI